MSAFNNQAQERIKKSYPLLHNEQVITVDGELNEAVWQQATKMALAFENKPGEGIPAPVKTEIYFYENGRSFNVAIKAFDPNPQDIRAALRDRDSLWKDDNVGIIVDTFNDERGGFEFFVNPLGAQADMKMSDANGWNEDSSWDAIWESAGKITEYGYVVEISIPFTSLRFPESNKPLIWNIAGWRNYPRNVRHQFATYQNDRNIKCSICQFDQIIGFENIKPSNNFQLTPTLTIKRADEKPVVPGDWQNGDTDVDPGLDIRWGITQDMVLNATINPDFSQVESDAGQLDINTTYSLFYDEKRPFFLDGSSYFDTSSFNLVHTRNIADPDYGVKLTGKSKQHSYGVIIANDNDTSFLMPGNSGSDLATLDDESQVAIMRYKADIGERSDAGVLLTHRAASGYSNSVVSLDGNYWFNSTDSLRYQVAHSDTDNPLYIQENYQDDEGHNIKANQTGDALSLGLSRSTRDFNLRANYTNISEDFRADLGFMEKVNYETLVLGGRRTWYGDKDDSLTEWGVFGDWDRTNDQDGKLLEEEYEIHGNIQGQHQLYSNFGIVNRKRFYNQEYFKENQFMMFAKIFPIDNLETAVFTRFGKQIDFANTQLGDLIAIEPRINWDANQHINLELSYNYSQLDVDDGRLYTAQLTEMRLGYQFNMQSKLKLVIQYTDIERDLDLYDYDLGESKRDRISRNYSTQLVYSYKINPQTLFYIGYSDSGYQDDDLDKLEPDQRTFFTKFSYAWQL